MYEGDVGNVEPASGSARRAEMKERVKVVKVEERME